MNDQDLGPQPDATIEDKEPNPGGVDALPESAEDEGLARDLDPTANPAVDDVAPDEISEPDEEKTQAPDGQADDAESGTEDDPASGQEAEDGSVEPPA